MCILFDRFLELANSGKQRQTALTLNERTNGQINDDRCQFKLSFIFGENAIWKWKIWQQNRVIMLITFAFHCENSFRFFVAQAYRSKTCAFLYFIVLKSNCSHIIVLMSLFKQILSHQRMFSKNVRSVRLWSETNSAQQIEPFGNQTSVNYVKPCRFSVDWSMRVDCLYKMMAQLNQADQIYLYLCFAFLCVDNIDWNLFLSVSFFVLSFCWPSSPAFKFIYTGIAFNKSLPHK